MKKRFLSIIILVILILALSFSLFACNKGVEFTLSFIVDGEVYYTINTAGEDTIKLPPNPQKDGFVFDGWYWEDGKAFTANSLLDTPLSENLSVYAKWIVNNTDEKEKEYTITFKSNGGGNINPITAKANAGISKPTDPTKDGYTFSGWFTDNETFENEFIFGTMPNEDIILYAKWTVNQYTLTYNTNGGNDIAAITVDYGTNLTAPTNPAKDGYTFKGWFTDDETFENEFIFDTMSNENITIYAKWEIRSEDNMSLEELWNDEKAEYMRNIFSDIDDDDEVEFEILYDSFYAIQVLMLVGLEFPFALECEPDKIDETLALVKAEFRGITYYLIEGTNIIAIDWFSFGYILMGDYVIIDDAYYTKDMKIFIKYNGNEASYTLPNSVTGIGSYAFFGCSSLTSINIPDSVTSIGYGAFYDTAWYDNLDDGLIYIGKVVYEYKGEMPDNTSITLREDTLSIASGAFYGCSSLVSITIPDSVSNIGNSAFAYCSSLTIYASPTSKPSGWSSDWNYYGWEGRIPVYWGVYSFDTYEDADFKYTIVNDFAIIDKYIGEADVVEIPSSITIPGKGEIPVTHIGEGAFRDNYNLASITIPNSITSIGNYAFYGCGSLTSVTIGNSVTSIGNYAFSDCSSLTSITIPDSVTSIGSDAFSGCSSLTSINIPDSVTSIGNYAFAYCSSLVNITVNENNNYYKSIDGNLYSKDGTKLIQYAIGKPDTSFTIPDSVTSIGNYAFYNCSSLTSVTIGNSVTSIGERAFSGCSNLVSIIIPNSVISIGDSAFAYCSSLESITIGNSVTSIGNYAFSGCSSLTSINIPNSVTSIGDSAFAYCSSLVNITVNENNNYYKSIDGNLYSKDGTKLIQYAIGKPDTSFTIPESVTSIGNYAFYNCSSLTSINIPDSVTSIGDSAFYGCGSLTSVTIGNSVTSIGDSAFYNCSSLTSITIPDSVTSIGSDAFSGCSSLTSINIPDSVTSIGNYAFSDCSSLTSITIPDSVTSIGSDAFSGCSSLTSINIPDSVTSIGDSAFAYCSSLVNITVNENNNYYKSIDGNLYSKDGTKLIQYAIGKPDTSFTIPESVTSIGNYAFYGCGSLTSVTIGNSVTSIGDSAFYNCSSLTSITIPDSVTSIGSDAFSGCSSLTIYASPTSKPSGWSSDWNYYGWEGRIPVYWGVYSFDTYEDADFKYTIVNDFAIIDKYIGEADVVEIPSSITIPGKGEIPVTHIGEGAFRDNYNLASITIPNSITSIGNYAFYGCGSLTSVTIGNSVTSIGNYAFSDCSSLTSITIPDSVTSIGSDAFSGCSSLTSINIPDSVTSIGYWAFSDCNSLIDVTIGNSVTSIGNYAFAYCSSLTSVTIGNSVTSIGNSAFAYCSSLVNITVNENNNYYKSIDGNLYSKDGTKLIQYAIGKPDTSFTIPESVTSIGSSAFYNCSSLTSIIIPDSVTSIGDSAFEHCSSLTSVIIGDSVTSIGNYAFYNCSSLTSVTIGNSVTSIGERAFSGCSNLVSIIIPNSVISIGDSAFAYCSSLTIYASPTSKPSGWSSDWNYYGWEGRIPVYWGVYSFDTYEDADFKYTIVNDFAIIDKYIGEADVVEIPSSITIPGKGEIPVTHIGEGAFRDNYNLASITIPNSITSIGDSAFYNCSSLTIYASPTSKPSGWSSDWNYYGWEGRIPVYWGVYSFDTYEDADFKYTIVNDFAIIDKYIGEADVVEIPSSITIPGKGEIPVTHIGEGAFRDNYNLASITIPNSITSIGNYAFYGCGSLTSVTIGNSVTSIGNYAFSDCSSLTSITIPDSVTSIGSDAFSGCSSLTSINIPDSVTSIGNYAFAYCSSLVNITVNENNNYYKSIDGNLYSKDGTKLIQYAIGKPDTSFTIPDSVTSIGNYAFYNCSSLTSVTIGNSVTSIGERAFSGCSNLVSIIIPNSVISIGDSAFAYCSSLESITIGNSVTSIGNYAFSGCSSLTSINIPDSVTSIGYWAFSNCNSLIDVTIGNSVTSIGDYAFEYCSSLESITIGNSVTSIGYSAFYNCNRLSSINIPDSVTSIGSSAFYNCSSLTSIIIPDSVTSIGDYAFYGCSSLVSITIPDSVSNIGNSAFAYCSSLVNITVNENNNYYKSIDGNLYSKDGTKLIQYAIGKPDTSFTIPESVTSIGYWAFSNCNSLIDVTIGNSVTSIGYYAFAYCSSLTIYAEATSKPNGWDSSWNPSNRPVVWGAGLDSGSTYVVSFTKSSSNPTNINASNGISNPYRAGYTFAGWYTASNFSSTKYDTIASAPNGTLYAKWIEND